MRASRSPSSIGLTHVQRDQPQADDAVGVHIRRNGSVSCHCRRARPQAGKHRLQLGDPARAGGLGHQAILGGWRDRYGHAAEGGVGSNVAVRSRLYPTSASARPSCEHSPPLRAGEPPTLKRSPRSPLGWRASTPGLRCRSGRGAAGCAGSLLPLPPAHSDQVPSDSPRPPRISRVGRRVALLLESDR
jgi:hypothetical protein